MPSSPIWTPLRIRSALPLLVNAPGTGILGDIDSLEQAVNNLEQGTGITQIDASKITGTINMSNLPNDVKFTMHTVADEEGRFALTEATVQNGDVVKQTDTEALYFVIDKTQLTSENGYQMISTPHSGLGEDHRYFPLPLRWVWYH